MIFRALGGGLICYRNRVGDITLLLRRIENGDAQAMQELMTRVYEAWLRLGGDEQPGWRIDWRSSPFTLAITSLDSSNAAGQAVSFDPTLSYSVTLASTTTGISGFAANKFTLDTSAFQNAFSGTWSVGQSGNNLNLVYTGGSAIPEPATYAAIFGTTALGFAAWRRRASRRTGHGVSALEHVGGAHGQAGEQRRFERFVLVD